MKFFKLIIFLFWSGSGSGSKCQRQCIYYLQTNDLSLFFIDWCKAFLDFIYIIYHYYSMDGLKWFLWNSLNFGVPKSFLNFYVVFICVNQLSYYHTPSTNDASHSILRRLFSIRNLCLLYFTLTFIKYNIFK